MILVILIGLFFLLSGILKLLDPVEFGQAILRYRIVGESMASLLALLLPWTEIVAGISLFLKSWRVAALWLIMAMLLVFELALMSAWMRGLDIECGCLGGELASSVQFAFFRNIPLIAACGWLLWTEGKRE